MLISVPSVLTEWEAGVHRLPLRWEWRRGGGDVWEHTLLLSGSARRVGTEEAESNGFWARVTAPFELSVGTLLLIEGDANPGHAHRDLVHVVEGPALRWVQTPDSIRRLLLHLRQPPRAL